MLGDVALEGKDADHGLVSDGHAAPPFRALFAGFSEDDFPPIRGKIVLHDAGPTEM
jgi:hypothetical protein